MDSLQKLSISYECSLSIGNALELPTMSRDFLKVFLKKTSAVYGAMLVDLSSDTYAMIASAGKDAYLEAMIEARPKKLENYAIAEDTRSAYSYLFIQLESYYLGFVYADTEPAQLRSIAEIFCALRQKIDLAVRACAEHERVSDLNREMAVKNAEISKSQALLRNIIDSVPARIFWKGMDSAYLGCNRFFAQDTGVKEKALIGKDDYALFPEKEADAHREKDRALLKTGMPVLNRKERLRRHDGTQLWTSASEVLLKDEAGETFGILGFYDDITERELVREKLKMSEKLLSDAQEIAHLGSWEWDIKAGHLFWSDEVYRIFGEEPQSFAPTYELFLQFLPPDDRQKVTDAVESSLRCNGPYAVEHRILRKDGSLRYVKESAELRFDVNHEPERMIGTVLDITDYQIALQKLQEQKEAFETIYRKSSDGILLIEEGHIVDCNESIVRILRAGSKKRLFTAKMSDHTPEFQPDGRASREKAAEMLAICMEKGVHHFEWLHRRMDGEPFWAEIVLTRLTINKKNVIHLAVHDISERKTMEERINRQNEMLMHQSRHDPLTGLPNRILFLDRLGQSIKKAKRNGEQLAVLFIDLDRFKEINDSLGHSVGDQVLRIIAKRLKESVRDSDTVARLGGDEFTLLLESVKHPVVAPFVAQKLIEIVKEPMHLNENELYLTMSIGISVYPQDGESADILLRNADAAMYKAKDSGRNAYEFYTEEMTENAYERIVIETSLRQALKRNELVVYYQPQFNIENEQCIGMEALVRWQHPSHELVSPGKFIPLAEETGLIVTLGETVLRQACMQMAAWYEQGFEPGHIAVNLSVKQLQQVNLCARVEQILEETRCRPEWLELEVTEGFIMKEPERAIKVLDQLKSMGIKLAIDDFGTGYSSLAYLKRLPITKLKIDQSFVRDVPGDSDDEAIVRTVIALGKSMKLTVLAEGVETVEQRNFLFTEGCFNIQGYLYARPMAAAEMTHRLQQSMYRPVFSPSPDSANRL
jgi:diguanylate cyclase (GGDEF)-like protein/PAS domain S-box-containing protein